MRSFNDRDVKNEFNKQTGIQPVLRSDFISLTNIGFTVEGTFSTVESLFTLYYDDGQIRMRLRKQNWKDLCVRQIGRLNFRCIYRKIERGSLS